MMLRKLSFWRDRNHNSRSSSKKRAQRRSPLRNSDLRIEALEWRNMLAGIDPDLSLEFRYEVPLPPPVDPSDPPVVGAMQSQSWDGDEVHLYLINEGDNDITGWEINWGDGSTTSVGDVPSVNHVYQDENEFGPTFFVTAFATRSDGTTSTTWDVDPDNDTEITVFDQQITASISGNLTANVNDAYKLNLSADGHGDDIVSWQIIWDLEDIVGSTETVDGNPPYWEHAYTTAGLYHIFAFAMDSDGAQSEGLEWSVDVSGSAPPVPGTTLDNGTLTVTGGTDNDSVTITRVGNEIRVNASVNGTNNPFPANISEVTSIVVNLGMLPPNVNKIRASTTAR